jgi:hypothetical protein
MSKKTSLKKRGLQASEEPPINPMLPNILNKLRFLKTGWIKQTRSSMKALTPTKGCEKRSTISEKRKSYLRISTQNLTNNSTSNDRRCLR